MKVIEHSQDPVCHSHVDDILPDDHPLAFRQVYCHSSRHKIKNSPLLHAGNNECMQTWFEFSNIALCEQCFIKYLSYSNGVIEFTNFRKWMDL